MASWLALRFALCLLLSACIVSCGGDSSGSNCFTADELKRIYRASPLPLPPADTTNAVADNPAAARLGQYIYFDTRFSANGKVSCATCHDPSAGFADGKRLSKGIGTTTRHAPSVVNAAYNRWFFWDGRADTQWAQALKPMEHPAEQGGSRLQFAHILHADAALRRAYEAIFGALPDLGDLSRFPAEGRPLSDHPGDDSSANSSRSHDRVWQSMTQADRDAVNRIYTNIGKSIAAYERLLISRDAPFDIFVEGLRENDPAKRAALSESAKLGLKVFMGRGNCHLCHQGPNFTNLEFHSVGIEQRDWLPEEDYGRAEGVLLLQKDPFNSAGPYSDDPKSEVAMKLRYLKPNIEQLGQFKVPTLRNIALTAPYMHGGQLESLQRVVKFYSDLDEIPPLNHREMFMQPLALSDSEAAALVAFLESLTGAPLPPELVTQPATPGPQ